MTIEDTSRPSSAPLFTVLTPTWNRASTLPRLYESLRAQTLMDFEWLVVDDGSDDETASLIAGLETDAPFPIRFVRQEHAGKPAAFERGVAAAAGTFVAVLDSDDAAVPSALELLAGHWNLIPEADRRGFVGVTGLTLEPGGSIIGDRFPADVFDSTPDELRYRYRVRGEKSGMQRTDVLRQFGFPTIPGESFIPEGILWDEIGRRYRTRYVNEPVRIVHAQMGPGSNQLTAADPSRHAPGMALWHAHILDDNVRWFRWAPAEFIRSAVHYGRFSALAGRDPLEQARRLRSWRARALWLIAAPVGWLVAARDVRRGRGREGSGRLRP